jgi:N-acetylmuramoyl-L-alanine amidase
VALRDVQARLSALGFYAGKLDGRWGPQTEGAVTAALDRLYAPPEPGAVSAAVVALQPKASRSVTEIVIHCTATPEGQDYSLATIRGWHMAMGWSDIGYHYIIHPGGGIEAGRPEERIGAHVIGHNTGTLGVSYIGGVAADGKTAKDTRTGQQRVMLMALCRALAAKYPDVTKISGHNQYANKACPSFDVRTDPLGSIV